MRKWWSRLSFLQTFHQQIIPEGWDLQLIKPITPNQSSTYISSQLNNLSVIYTSNNSSCSTKSGHDTLRREINKSGQNCVWSEDAWEERCQQERNKGFSSDTSIHFCCPSFSSPNRSKIRTEILQSNISVYINWLCYHSIWKMSLFKNEYTINYI